MNNLKLSRTTIIIGLLILVGAMFFLPRVLGGNDSDDDNDTPNVTNPDNGNQPGNQVQDTGATLGPIYTSAALDRDGCAANTTTTFNTTSPIYVVAEDSQVEQGTSVFVRIYYQGQVIEDLPEITAQEDFNNTCINFVIEPAQGAAFQPGQYEAEFIVNGNQAQSVTFQVQ